MRLQVLGASLVFLGLVCLAGPVAAAEGDPLALVPRDAWGFVVAPRLAEAEATLQRLAKETPLVLPPDLFDMAGLNEGLDRRGTALVIVMPGGAGPRPAVVVALPTTDYDRLLKSFAPGESQGDIQGIDYGGRKCLAAAKGKMALFAGANDRGALEKVLQSPPEAPRGLGGLKSWLDEHALGIVVMRPGIEAGTTAAIGGLEQLKATMTKLAADAKKGTPSPSKANIEQVSLAFDIYIDIARLLGRETRMTAGAVRLNEQGTLEIDWRTRFQGEGQIARILAAVEPAEKDVLAELPDEPFMLAGGGVYPKELFNLLMDWSGKVISRAPSLYGLSPEQSQEMVEAAKESLAGGRGMAMLWGVSEPGDPLYSRLLVTLRVDDAKQMLAKYRDYVGKFNKAVGDRPAFFGPMTVKETVVAGQPGLEMTMNLPKTLPGQEIHDFGQIMESMFGSSDKMVIYMAAVDNHALAVGYVSPKMVERAVQSAQQADSGLNDRDDVAALGKVLPKQASWRLLLSPAGAIEWMNRTMSISLPKDAPRVELPPFPATPPIAWSATAGKAEFRERIVVPAEVLQAIVPYAGQLRQRFQPPSKQQPAK